MERKNFRILHIAPALLLVLVLMISLLPTNVSAASFSAHSWVDYIDRLSVEDDSLYVYTSYDLSDSWWRYDSVSHIGQTFEFQTSSTVDLTLYAGSYIDLSTLPDGSVFNLGLSFEVDEEYSGVGFNYYISIGYYDSNFNYVSGDKSSSLYYETSSGDLVCGFTARGYDPDTGAPSTIKYCRLSVHISAPGGILVRAGVRYLSLRVECTDLLKNVMPPAQFQQFAQKSYRLWDLYKNVWYPDDVAQKYVLVHLESYFGARDDVVVSPDFDFDFSEGQFELEQLFNNALEQLGSFMGVFAAVSEMFNYLFQIPYISVILLVSLGVGVGALILGLTFNVNVRSDSVEYGSSGRKDDITRNAKGLKARRK